ncbi:MAG TPA: alkaline phosphatase D family protein [Capillimicrobium sp.]|nr:alkaline phosphatase D family protein [Capillimicrobium sp.]
MAQLVLGPLLRRVGPTEATIWVETDAACEVEVLGGSDRTFEVEGHHFGLVCLTGLEPGSTIPYEVRLDGERVWPRDDDPYPPCAIRTAHEETHRGEPFVLAFGSCRVAFPHEEPYTLRKDDDARGREVDALRAMALRMMDAPIEEWPHALLLLGDQVYADEVSPETLAFIRSRRSTDDPPGEQIADFEEYTRLYREAWSEPVMRWLLSTVPSAMIFDDHDVHDDWNTSEAWLHEIRRQPWWEARIEGALMSYWCYQHLGNLSPDDLARDDVFARVREAGDGSAVLRDFAGRAHRTTDGTQWSYRRDWGKVRLVMIDSRAGRVLEGGDRSMLDEDEWRWLEDTASGDVDHLLLGTSLPWLLERGLHDLEAWNEAVCNGAWGRWATGWAEKLRQALDLEHWAAFEESFVRLTRLVADIATGRRGRAPETIVALSGDVHHAYLSRVDLAEPARSRVYQAVCSPFRNPLDKRERRMILFTGTKLASRIGAALARSARVRTPAITWKSVHGKPWFDNQIVTLTFSGPDATLRLERTTPEEPQLQVTFEHRL